MKCTISTLLLLASQYLWAQNLVYNSGFEDINICTELGSACGAEAWFRSPPRKSGRKIAKAKGYNKIYQGIGSEIIVVENTKNPIKNRVFIYSMMKCKLVKGEKYNISLWLNPLKNNLVELDILLSDHELVPGVKNPLSYNPSFSFGRDHIIKTEGQWTNYTYEYIARGGERFITLGNFDKERYCPEKNLLADNRAGDLMYFIDNISVQPAHPTGMIDCDSTLIRKMLYSFHYRHSYKVGLSYKKGLIKKQKLDTTPNTSKSIETFEIPNIAFSFDSHQLNAAYFSHIDSIIRYIGSITPSSIEIIGHTDDIGNERYNRNLSLKRAAAVRRILVDKDPKLDSLISIIGMGEDAPKVENSSDKNRQINRRVELKVKI